MATLEDTQIIDLYHRRDGRAIAETSDKYGRLLYSIANNILHNNEDSEEAVNDTYTGAWNAMPPQRPKALCAFLSRITRNTSISYYRRNNAMKRQGILLELSELEGADSLQESMDLHLLTVSIEQFLQNQPKDERVLFLRRYFFAYSIAELAVQSQSSENQVSGRLFRLRKKLRHKLEKEGFCI